MSETTYGVGIVGCGSTGRSHAEAYRANDRTTVAAAADPDDAARSGFGEAFDVPAGYENHREMLASEDLDIVAVCTFHGTHAEIAIDAAEAGIDGVLCEKPIATNLGETRDVLDAVDRNDVKLTVAHKRRFHPVHVTARDLIVDGAIGEPQLVTGRHDDGLLNWGTHVIDLVRFLLGDPDLAWVMGQVERRTDRYERGVPAEDRCVGHACFDDGTRLTYESDMPGPAVADWTIQVTGSAGTLELDLDSAVTVTGPDGVESYDPEPDSSRLYDSFLDEFVAWLDGARDGHRCDGQTARAVMEIMMGIYESARTDGVVEAPVRTRANPLTVMIEDGDLPVEYPGRYDIRIPYASVRSDPEPDE